MIGGVGDENEFGTINNGGSDIVRQMEQYFYDENSYVDISVPWNIRLSMDYSYRWTPTNTTTRKSIKANGQIGLTPKWQVTYNTGYDFDAKDFTTTSVGLYRDLGCW